MHNNSNLRIRLFASTVSGLSGLIFRSVDALRLGFEPQALSIGLRPPPPSDRPSPQAASLRPARFLDHPVNPRKLCLGVRGIDSHGSARVLGSAPPACPQLHRKPPLTCRFCLAQRRYRPGATVRKCAFGVRSKQDSSITSSSLLTPALSRGFSADPEAPRRRCHRQFADGSQRTLSFLS
jgi:hypothetical protein